MDSLVETGGVDSDGSKSPSFYISYAHADADYVERLCAVLSGEGLPYWYDRRLEWGSRFPVEICNRIEAALAVIVVMSPASQDSEWVEREVLEAQQRNRQILPILLDGERLFLLAASHFVDARTGALPGERELRQLRRMVEATRSAEILPLLRPASPPALAPLAAEEVDLSLRRLRQHLAQGELAHADIVTTSLLLGAADRLDEGWMRHRDAERLGFGDLAAIDTAWSDHSGGRQGFRAQLAARSGPVRGGRLAGRGEFLSLASALGWKAVTAQVTPRYSEFVSADRHPLGFFPTLRNPQLERHQGWHDRWVETALAVHTRLHRWEGQR